MTPCNVTIREYGRLTTAVVPQSLDLAQVSHTAFDWLCDLSTRFNRNGAPLLQQEGRQILKWDAYVGVVETPCGTRLEILPKHHEQGDCVTKSRQLLSKLIQNALHLKPREAAEASLGSFNAPLSEWVIGQFLAELDLLVKRGVRFDYQRVEEERLFLRGQLNVVQQMRQPPGRQHHFHLRHDVFLADRAENRLLKLAVERVAKTTRNPANWRLASELRVILAEVPASKKPNQDFRAWSVDRLMAHYQPVKPWLELVLNQHMPMAVHGEWRGISLLFPMGKLFEHYVGSWLKAHLAPSAKLTLQASRHRLCSHGGGEIFRLSPDFFIEDGKQAWVLDTKWKRLDGQNRQQNYGLSQADFYQLFAYGQTYLGGTGEMALIYPRAAGFLERLEPFDFVGGLRLWVVPFDMDEGGLVGWEAWPAPVV